MRYELAVEQKARTSPAHTPLSPSSPSNRIIMLEDGLSGSIIPKTKIRSPISLKELRHIAEAIYLNFTRVRVY
jgi:hypothetical protein